MSTKLFSKPKQIVKDGKEESIYVFANYSSLIRHSDNQKLFDELNVIMGRPDNAALPMK
jgi:hypothetical protein